MKISDLEELKVTINQLKRKARRERAKARKQEHAKRMHHFASMCNKAYTDSPLYNHLGELNN